jgi:hypothetical protein
MSDALSRLDINNQKIQDGEALDLLFEPENSNIRNIKFQMYTSLIFKEKSKFKLS